MPDDQNRYYHGTRADLRAGDHIAVGSGSNYVTAAPLSWVYFSARLESAIWGAELATGSGRERVYIVEPTGPFEDDPNLTDKKFPGNPTRSYRSLSPLRIVGEIADWTAHPPKQVRQMKENVARLMAGGAEIID